MKKSIIVRAPVLSRSGYGYQARFALKALRAREDIFDIYILNIPWGQTGWIWRDDEFRNWMDERIMATIKRNEQKLGFDISLQITIPNEWERMAPVNIGYTAGIETNKVSPGWLQKGNEMDKIITISNHSKQTYMNTKCKARATAPDGGVHVVDYNLTTPIDVVGYAVDKTNGKSPIDELELTTDFNFLCVAQWGPRKNVANTIKWFVEEFHDEEVGLVIKTNLANDSLTDFNYTQRSLTNLLTSYPDRKCKVYLLHGNLSREQLSWLYTHDNINAFVSFAHGEGFGLPIFEAAYHGLPVIAVGWSGQLDYLIDLEGNEKFYSTDFSIAPVQKEVHWQGVIEPDSAWSFADDVSAKQQMRKCYNDLTGDNEGDITAKTHAYANELSIRFSKDTMYSAFTDVIYNPDEDIVII